MALQMLNYHWIRYKEAAHTPYSAISHGTSAMWVDYSSKNQAPLSSVRAKCSRQDSPTCWQGVDTDRGI